MTKWEAKKSNYNNRVRAYMNPGVSEVIYSNEWKPKHKSLIVHIFEFFGLHR